MSAHLDEVISFKVESSLAEVIRRLPNRSQFIRSAVLEALEHTCPLCQGTGILTPEQQEHWREFAERHSIRDCTSCGHPYLVCAEEGS
jgi:hypothetical protein